MGIYNYLFYKSFVLAKKSRNYDDCPVLGGLVWLLFCISLNILTIIGFLEGFGISMGSDFILKYKWPIALLSCGLMMFYYLYNGRYKKIVAYYEKKKEKSINIHPIIVIIFYVVVSFGLMLLAGLFKNKDWIFAQ